MRARQLFYVDADNTNGVCFVVRFSGDDDADKVVEVTEDEEGKKKKNRRKKKREERRREKMNEKGMGKMGRKRK